MRQSALMSTEYKRLAALRPKELREAIAPAVGLLRVEIERAMNAGIVRRDDPLVLARILLNVGSAHINTALLETSDGARSGMTSDLPRLRDLWKFCRHVLEISF